MAEDFDRWLEDELQRASLVLSSQSVPAAPRYRDARRGRWLASWPLSRGLGVLACVLAIAAAGTGVAAAAGGTANPHVWAQQVQTAVVTCQERSNAGPDVGACIAAFAGNRPSSPPAASRPSDVPLVGTAGSQPVAASSLGSPAICPQSRSHPALGGADVGQQRSRYHLAGEQGCSRYWRFRGSRRRSSGRAP